MSKNVLQPAFVIIGGDPRTPVAQVRKATKGILASVKNKGFTPVLIRVSDNDCTLAACDAAKEMRVAVRYGDVVDVVNKIATYHLPTDRIYVVLFQTPEYTGGKEALDLLYGCDYLHGTLTMWSVFHGQWTNSELNLPWVRGFNAKFLRALKSRHVPDKGAHFAEKIRLIQKYPSLYKGQEKEAGAKEAKSATQKPSYAANSIPNVPVPLAAPADSDGPAGAVAPTGKTVLPTGGNPNHDVAANDSLPQDAACYPQQTSGIGVQVPLRILPQVNQAQYFPVPPVFTGKNEPVKAPAEGISPDMLLAYLNELASYIKSTAVSGNNYSAQVEVTPANKDVYGTPLVASLKLKQNEIEILPAEPSEEQPASTNRGDNDPLATASTNRGDDIGSTVPATSAEPVPEADTSTNRGDNSGSPSDDTPPWDDIVLPGFEASVEPNAEPVASIATTPNGAEEVVDEVAPQQSEDSAPPWDDSAVEVPAANPAKFFYKVMEEADENSAALLFMNRCKNYDLWMTEDLPSGKMDDFLEYLPKAKPAPEGPYHMVLFWEGNRVIHSTRPEDRDRKDVYEVPELIARLNYQYNIKRDGGAFRNKWLRGKFPPKSK